MKLFLKTLGAALLLGSLLLAIVVTVARAEPTGPTGETGDNGAPESSWYVCKYVGTPGDTETLQTGQNPIFVNEHSIETYPNVAVGDDFSDAQGHSVVVAGPYAPPGLEVEPACPTSTPTPTPTPTVTPTPTTPPTTSPSPTPTTTTTPIPTVSPTTPPPTPTVTPTVTLPPKETPRNCHGNGADRPRCTPAPAATELAFTGSAVVPLALGALFLFLTGLGLLWRGRLRA